MDYWVKKRNANLKEEHKWAWFSELMGKFVIISILVIKNMLAYLFQQSLIYMKDYVQVEYPLSKMFRTRNISDSSFFFQIWEYLHIMGYLVDGTQI